MLAAEERAADGAAVLVRFELGVGLVRMIEPESLESQYCLTYHTGRQLTNLPVVQGPIYDMRPPRKHETGRSRRPQ